MDMQCECDNAFRTSNAFLNRFPRKKLWLFHYHVLLPYIHHTSCVLLHLFVVVLQLIRKQIENQLPVKSRLHLHATKLAHLHHPNERHLQMRIDNIEKKWLHLVAMMPANEEQLHEAQMALLPSRQALREVMAWIDEMEVTLRDMSANAPRCLEDVQLMLKRYRVKLSSISIHTYHFVIAGKTMEQHVQVKGRAVTLVITVFIYQQLVFLPGLCPEVKKNV